jgi:hypothetical protein
MKVLCRFVRDLMMRCRTLEARREIEQEVLEGLHVGQDVRARGGQLLVRE